MLLLLLLLLLLLPLILIDDDGDDDDGDDDDYDGDDDSDGDDDADDDMFCCSRFGSIWIIIWYRIPYYCFLASWTMPPHTGLHQRKFQVPPPPRMLTMKRHTN